MEDADLVTPEFPGQRLISHSLLNAGGQAAPVIVAVFAVPLLMRALGTERFGLLTLAWGVVGYFGLFDIGLSRALTQLIAERRRGEAHGALAATVRRALGLMTVVGLAAGVAALVAAPWLIDRALTVSPSLRHEALNTFRLLAVGIPVVVVGTGLRGVLEGFERFDLVNVVRIPLGVSTFLGPLAAMPFTRSLQVAVGTILIARVAGLVVHAAMARRLLNNSRGGDGVPIALGSVLRSGAWMTVSNVLSPIMTLADRFIIASIVSTSVVAYYTAPYEMASRLSGLVAVAVATSLFPAFASWRGTADVRVLYSRGLRLTAAVITPLMLGLAAFPHWVLAGWMGEAFARESAGVLRILAIGVLMNGLAQVPFALIQAVGRADLTAKIHIAEVPAYLVLVVHLIRINGVEGAALAWTIRVSADALAMFVVSRRLMDAPSSASVAREAA